MPPGEEPRAQAYFVELLGMLEEEKPSPLKERGGCWFRCGRTVIHLGVEAAFTPQRKAHAAFLIDDLDKLARRMEASGYPVEWDTALPDRRRFYTKDPFENRLEFIESGDGFSECS